MLSLVKPFGMLRTEWAKRNGMLKVKFEFTTKICQIYEIGNKIKNLTKGLICSTFSIKKTQRFPFVWEKPPRFFLKSGTNRAFKRISM